MNHFLDIGANVGQTFDDFLLKRPDLDGWTVWCFEPSPRHLPALMAKAAEVAPFYASVRIVPAGVGGEYSLRRFWTKDDPRGDSFSVRLASDHETKNLAEGFEIHAVTVDIADFIERTPGRHTVKIDAEGAEYAIMERLIGATHIHDRIDCIMVEWHDTDTHEARSASGYIERARSAGLRVEPWEY